ncbi:hypothetical protein BC834DRAFT_465888 [Gloeopeniophorella convolvens]|nr:hypothetical protein BC834DRAFT_465888 [Gloeopeniophorella convolvens]
MTLSTGSAVWHCSTALSQLQEAAYSISTTSIWIATEVIFAAAFISSWRCLKVDILHVVASVLCCDRQQLTHRSAVCLHLAVIRPSGTSMRVTSRAKRTHFIYAILVDADQACCRQLRDAACWVEICRSSLGLVFDFCSKSLSLYVFPTPRSLRKTLRLASH